MRPVDNQTSLRLHLAFSDSAKKRFAGRKFGIKETQSNQGIRCAYSEIKDCVIQRQIFQEGLYVFS